jgi:hypothetical protein
MANSAQSAAVPAPHSWDIEHWPALVYPHTPSKGRYLVRSNRDSLVVAGALIRVGRDLVIIGAQYSKWLSGQAGRVASFAIAPNSKVDSATSRAT